MRSPKGDSESNIYGDYEMDKEKFMNEEKIIKLSYDQWKNLSCCPNCGSRNFVIDKIPQPNHPLKLDRVIIKCSRCGAWSDWFNLWFWHIPQASDEEYTCRKH